MPRIIPEDLEKRLRLITEEQKLSVSILVQNGYELSTLTDYFKQNNIPHQEVPDLGMVATSLQKGQIYHLASKPYVVLILYDEPLKA